MAHVKHHSGSHKGKGGARCGPSDARTLVSVDGGPGVTAKAAEATVGVAVYTAHLSERNRGARTAVGRPACRGGGNERGPRAVTARAGTLGAWVVHTSTAVWRRTAKVKRLEEQEQEYQTKVQQLLPDDPGDLVRGIDHAAPGGRDAAADGTVAAPNRPVPRGGVGEQPPVGGLPYLVSTGRLPTYGAGIGPRHRVRA